VRRLRGSVYVITALDEKSLARGMELEDDVGEDRQAQDKRFESLTTKGIYVRGHSSCHAKFLIVDDAIALVSSANLETSALVRMPDGPQRWREPTGESGVVIDDAVEVDRLARLFTRLWYEGCEWEVPPGTSYTVEQRPRVDCPCAIHHPRVGAHSSVIWTHDTEHYILETIHDIIDRARRELILSTFSLSGLATRADILTSPSAEDIIIDPIRRAVDRGVNVRLLLRGRNNMAGHRRDASVLSALGVRLFGDTKNHAKAAFADGRHGAIFSANFDLQHGLINGVEVGVRLDGTRALGKALDYFEHSLENADLDFEARPSLGQLDYSLAARWRCAWPCGPLVKTSPADDASWETFRDASSDGPVLFTRKDSEPMTLHANGGRWSLKAAGHGGTYVLSLVDRPGEGSRNATSSLLEQWLGSRQNFDHSQGFCPATFERI
jgi:phosphatidylserine/phosphatidylglycerophosphate/cardiolipin synthase-like enzyme